MIKHFFYNPQKCCSWFSPCWEKFGRRGSVYFTAEFTLDIYFVMNTLISSKSVEFFLTELSIISQIKVTPYLPTRACEMVRETRLLRMNKAVRALV